MGSRGCRAVVLGARLMWASTCLGVWKGMGGEGGRCLLACVGVSALPKSGSGGINGSLTLWVVSFTLSQT